MNKDNLQKIESALEELRPFLRKDGGDIELVNVEGSTVYVRLLGNCVGCPVNQMTLRAGVETTIKQHVPEITEVINLSD
ncbi:MAG: NifU family protein [Weeksellaceae bacterium]|nr:NifU family protein [Weeksellaceae bacterium]